MKMKSRHVWTEKEDRLLIEWYPYLYCNFLSKWMQRSERAIYSRVKSLGISKSKYFLSNELRNQGVRLQVNGKAFRYPKGHLPANKGKKMSAEVYEKAKHTFFQKGHIPVNAKERDGEISIRHDHANRR
jgi:hypothetical protein